MSVRTGAATALDSLDAAERNVLITYSRGGFDVVLRTVAKGVAATDAFVRIAGQHVPGSAILAVHHPSLLGDSTARDPGKTWRAAIPAALRVADGQQQIT